MYGVSALHRLLICLQAQRASARFAKLPLLAGLALIGTGIALSGCGGHSFAADEGSGGGAGSIAMPAAGSSAMGGSTSCTLDLRGAVVVYVEDENGESISASVTVSVNDGASPSECEHFADLERYVCWEAGPGTYQVTVVVGAETQTQAVELASDGCHVVGPTPEFTFRFTGDCACLGDVTCACAAVE